MLWLSVNICLIWMFTIKRVYEQVHVSVYQLPKERRDSSIINKAVITCFSMNTYHQHQPTLINR